ncbi:import inner membrane translocase subunit tim22 [Anaeramoeba flamelloides]|uniref:Import inner membrane translocase subunit tim22 n=1 Tax=Anaeramoeba flamelloides TaxID=1746091 RepID=A0ABQ8YMW2_9EUKA|nr:import inner membrane translocase subunit tim22 [Anaeramoeba flamelloides]
MFFKREERILGFTKTQLKDFVENQVAEDLKFEKQQILEYENSMNSSLVFNTISNAMSGALLGGLYGGSILFLNEPKSLLTKKALREIGTSSLIGSMSSASWGFSYSACKKYMPDSPPIVHKMIAGSVAGAVVAIPTKRFKPIATGALTGGVIAGIAHTIDQYFEKQSKSKN